jgi:hypothetical protein
MAKKARERFRLSSGPGRLSPENVKRPIADRLQEARELLARLSDFYNHRVFVLEQQEGLSRKEAERQAMAEVKASATYRAWRSLG